MALPEAPTKSSFLSHPLTILTLATLMWGGNSVAGRLAVGEVSPMVVVFLRWTLVSLFMVLIAGRRTLQEWPAMKPYFWKIVLTSFIGYTTYNTLFYVAAHSTSAVNIGIIQGATPVIVLLGAFLFFRTRAHMVQILGILATIVGVAAVASQGSLETLVHFKINPGDSLMVIAAICYGIYTLMLRMKPPVSGLSFFTIMSLTALVVSIPAMVWEVSTGTAQWPTANGWLIVLYIALFPSCLAQLLYMKGVELIGPGRAGIFINLIPIFSAFFGVIILGEAFHVYHAIALVLVLGGIWLSEQAGKKNKG